LLRVKNVVISVSTASIAMRFDLWRSGNHGSRHRSELEIDSKKGQMCSVSLKRGSLDSSNKLNGSNTITRKPKHL
jgi:hypothetical protein